MATDPKELQFIEDKEETIDNLESLQEALQLCVNGGFHDIGEAIHNQLLDLIDDTVLSSTYPEIEEVIEQAKTIEKDLDVWLAHKGRTTFSLSWPRTNKS